MYETFNKSTQHPCMSKGKQSKKDFIGCKDNGGQRAYPGSGASHQLTDGNEQHKTLKQGSGLMGSVPNGSGKFGTEKSAPNFLPGSGKKA